MRHTGATVAYTLSIDENGSPEHPLAKEKAPADKVTPKHDILDKRNSTILRIVSKSQRSFGSQRTYVSSQ